MRRPAPPEAFSKAESVVWHRIVEACPPEWFTPENQPLLARLCFLIVMTEQQEAKLRADGFIFADKNAARAYFDATKQIVHISTKLRLSPQSRYNRFEASSRMRNRATHRLWDDDEGPKLRVVSDDD
jgi:hypothetical protein